MLAGLQVLVVLGSGDVAIAEIILLWRALRIDQAHTHELFRVREGKSAQDKGINNGELRGNPGDPQREDQHGQQTERFFFEENPQTDAEILAKVIEDHSE